MIIIKSQVIEISELEKNLYFKILDALDISFEEVSDEPHLTPDPNYKVQDLLNDLSPRAANCIKWLVNSSKMDQPVAEFLNKYKSIDFIRLRNFGKKSYRELQGVLLDHGYMIKTK